MKQTNAIKDLPPERRPYEKCSRYGISSLTDSELLACIIRTGSKGEPSIDLAENILNYEGNTSGILNILHLDTAQLLRIRGIGQVKAIQIQCVAELSKRISRARIHNNLSFTDPKSISDYYMEEMRHKDREHLVLLLLNTKSNLIKDIVISQGTVNASLVSPREIFIQALKYNAVNVILLHNHPSGHPEPSREDILITRRVQEAGSLIGISLIDHIIIGDNIYVSFKERGII
ncbi:RadC family protein [Parasporobacterium paucivorans]|uniref:RadC family protein n=1 Tax=Parasporobacterium paucivorans TaxID=115544 RepID=UPI00093F1EA2